MKIAVLKGWGINSEPVLQSLKALKTLHPTAYDFAVQEVTNKNLHVILDAPETVALILPGSDSSQHTRNALGSEGMEHIRNFALEQGGALLGICSGAYMLGHNITYGHCFDTPYHRSSKDNLRLINADFYGPLPDYLQPYAYLYPDKPYLSLATVTYADSTVVTHVPYWQGGVPKLPLNQTELRPLAYFAHPYHISTDDTHHDIFQPIAIGVKDLDPEGTGGKAIASAVHPEVTGAYVARHTETMAKKHRHYRDLQDEYRDIALKLTRNQKALDGLFRTVIDELLDCGKARFYARMGLQSQQQQAKFPV